MRIRTWLSRASFIGAAFLLVLALVAPALEAQEDPDADRPGSFQASAFTTAFEAIINTQPASTVPDIVRFDIPLGQSEFASGNRSFARAASIWPGLTVAKGASLFCTAGFPCEEFEALPTGFPPRWPLAAEASYPTQIDSEGELVRDQPNGQSAAAGPITFTVNVLEAHAGRDFVSGRAVIEDIDFPMPGGGEAAATGTDALGLPGSASAAEEESASLIHVGSLQSTTRHEFQDDVLVAFAESRLADIDLFGQLHIDKLVARSTSRSNGDDVAASEPRILVEGVTFAGVPATITEDGVRLNEGQCVAEVPQAGRLCTDDQGLLPALSTGLGTLSDGEVRLIDATTLDEEGRSDGDATGLLVSFTADASGFPGGSGVVGNLILGLASTSAGIGNFTEGELDLGDFPVDGDVTPAGLDSSQVAGAQVESTPGTPGTPGRTIRRPQATPQPRFGPLELLAGIAADRIQLLYGAWAFSVVGLALASRLPGARLVTRR